MFLFRFSGVWCYVRGCYTPVALTARHKRFGVVTTCKGHDPARFGEALPIARGAVPAVTAAAAPTVRDEVRALVDTLSEAEVLALRAMLQGGGGAEGGHGTRDPVPVGPRNNPRGPAPAGVVDIAF